MMRCCLRQFIIHYPSQEKQARRCEKTGGKAAEICVKWEKGFPPGRKALRLWRRCGPHPGWRGLRAGRCPPHASAGKRRSVNHTAPGTSRPHREHNCVPFYPGRMRSGLGVKNTRQDNKKRSNAFPKNGKVPLRFWTIAFSLGAGFSCVPSPNRISACTESLAKETQPEPFFKSASALESRTAFSK